MFIPNTRAYWYKKNARRTITGKETFGAARLIPIGIVHIKDTTVPTTVRADSSASRGAAEEHDASAKILVPPQFPVTRGDVLKVDSSLIEITSIEPRRDVFGHVDHLEVAGDIRASL